MADEFRRKYGTLFISAIFCVVPLIMIPFYEDLFYHFKIFTIYFCCFMLLLMNYKKLNAINLKDIRENLYLEDYLLLGFLMMASLSTIFSIDITLAIFGETAREEGLMALLCYGAIYFIASRAFKPNIKLMKLALTVFAFICIIGCVQFFFKDLNILYNTREVLNGVAFSTMGNRNFASSYIILVLPLCIYCYISKGNRYHFILILIGFTALLCTLTRSGWLAFSLEMLAFLYYSLKTKVSKGTLKRFVIMFVSFVVIALTVNNFSSGAILGRYLTIGADAINSVAKKDESGGTDRIFIWKRALILIGERPLLGSGPDTFGVTFMGEYGKEYFKFINRNRNPDRGEELYYITINKAHNEYLQIAATIGIPALIFYSLFILVNFVKLYKQIKFNSDIIPLFIAIAGYMVQAFFNISVVSVAPVLWGILGIAIGKTRIVKEFEIRN